MSAPLINKTPIPAGLFLPRTESHSGCADPIADIAQIDKPPGRISAQKEPKSGNFGSPETAS
jgi:hypothetical protein